MKLGAPYILGLFVLASLASIGFAISAGTLAFSPADLWRIVSMQGNATETSILFDLRLPRALSAFACGALLAIAGTLLQVLLRNPLADPYILGVSGGAAVAVLLAMLAGLVWQATQMAALGGAALAIAIVFTLSYAGGNWNMHRLLLTGVVLSAGFGALISLLLTLAPEARIHGMLFWLMGDLAHAQRPAETWAILVVVLILALWQSRKLDVLAIGDLKARSLGVPVLRLQLGIYFLAAAATAAVVVEAGAIGFVGFVIPHMVRLMGVTLHRWLLPLSAALGGTFLAFADTLAKTLVAPQQLPVGVLTAVLGVPILLFLLRRIRA